MKKTIMGVFVFLSSQALAANLAINVSLKPDSLLEEKAAQKALMSVVGGLIADGKIQKFSRRDPSSEGAPNFCLSVSDQEAADEIVAQLRTIQPNNSRTQYVIDSGVDCK